MPSGQKVCCDPQCITAGVSPENEPLVRHHFEEITPRNAPPQFTVEGRFQRMQQACNDLGAPADRIELVESLYLRLLKKMDKHFANHPYLLGGKPCVGDFGLIAPMYAHLGRDLRPRTLMHEHAIHVLRWVERMNRSDSDFSARHSQAASYLDDDKIPDTLIEVLRHIAIDFVPETAAACDTINNWIQQQTNLAAGTTVERSLGFATFVVEGQSITAAAQPFRFYVLKRVQDALAAMSDPTRSQVSRPNGRKRTMSTLFSTKLVRDIGRAGNLEIWQ